MSCTTEPDRHFKYGEEEFKNGNYEEAITWLDGLQMNKARELLSIAKDSLKVKNENKIENEILKLTNQVREIPASKYRENFSIYERLAELDSDNREFIRKKDYYYDKWYNQEYPKFQYSIVEENDISYANVRRKTLRIRLKSSNPSDQILRRAARAICNKGYSSLDEFTVWMYLPEMDAYNTAYVTAEFRSEILYDFNINEWLK